MSDFSASFFVVGLFRSESGFIALSIQFQETLNVQHLITRFT